jgi:hypothetical protein
MVSKSKTISPPKKTSSKEKSIKKDRIVIGRIYSETCPHCIVMEPEWDTMKTNITEKCHNNNVSGPEYLEIEAHDLDDLTEFNNDNKEFLQNKLIENKGYPTIFVIYRNGVKYYEGQRSADKMENIMASDYYKDNDILYVKPIGGKKTKNNRTIKKRKNKKTKKNIFSIFGF